MKFKDILEVITTYNKIRIITPHGEEFYPCYSELEGFKDYCVLDIGATDKNVISISVGFEEV